MGKQTAEGMEPSTRAAVANPSGQAQFAGNEGLVEGEEDFAAHAQALRRRLRSSLDSSAVIRADPRP
jgi:hypothetical protein